MRGRVKSRRTRSAAGTCAGSRRVVRIFRRLHRPARPWRAISRSTALWLTVMPSRASWAVTRGDPYRRCEAGVDPRDVPGGDRPGSRGRARPGGQPRRPRIEP